MSEFQDPALENFFPKDEDVEKGKLFVCLYCPHPFNIYRLSDKTVNFFENKYGFHHTPIISGYLEYNCIHGYVDNGKEGQKIIRELQNYTMFEYDPIHEDCCGMGWKYKARIYTRGFKADTPLSMACKFIFKSISIFLIYIVPVIFLLLLITPDVYSLVAGNQDTASFLQGVNESSGPAAYFFAKILVALKEFAGSVFHKN